jgi:hypothetical protein
VKIDKHTWKSSSRHPGPPWPFQIRVHFSGILACLAASIFLLAVSACSTARTPLDGSQFASVDGNWVFTMTTTSGAAPFSALDGYINDEANGTVTAAFQAQVSQQDSPCYLGAETLPLQGALTGTQLGLYSFSDNGQYLSVTGTENSTGTQLTGTFKISGGCAKNVSGTLTGTHYDVLNGTYSGAFAANSSYSAQLTLQQNTLGTGSGNFFVGGSAAFTGISCFTSGTMPQTQGSIIGNAVQLQFTTNETGASSSTVSITGTIDPLAKTLTVTSSSITGGNCAGNLGTGTFSLQ